MKLKYNLIAIALLGFSFSSCSDSVSYTHLTLPTIA